MWAGRNVGRDIEPPTAAAWYWLKLAQEQPEKFIAAVAELNASIKQPQSNTNVVVGKKESPAAPDLANTWWSGSEGANRKLSFLFRSDGKVLITDEVEINRGTWTAQAGQLSIDLSNLLYGNATYRGTFHDNDSITGTCVRVSGHSWPFSVTRQT